MVTEEIGLYGVAGSEEVSVGRIGKAPTFRHQAPNDLQGLLILLRLDPDPVQKLRPQGSRKIVQEQTRLIGRPPVVERNPRMVDPVGQKTEIVLITGEHTTLHVGCNGLIKPGPPLGFEGVERPLLGIEDVCGLMDGLGRCPAKYRIGQRLTAATGQAYIWNPIAI